ncbi:MAG: sulfatase-like hydrolase/transferase [Planctomycetota bacterium]
MRRDRRPTAAPRTRTLVAGAALTALLAGCGRSSPRTVLVVSLDTARADGVSLTDTAVTPRLARLAERGTVFEQAIAGSSWTLPSHAQMFTGQPPALHGVLDDDVVIDPLTPTLPELLDDQGFFTGGIYSGVYLAKAFGFGRGFDEYVNAIEGGAELEGLFESSAELGGGEAGAAWRSFDLQSHRDVSSPRIVRAAEGLLRAAGSKDLLLFAHFFDPHYDYIPPAPYDARFTDPDYAGELDGADFWSNPRIFDEEGRPQALPPEDLQHLLALYLGELSWTDEHVGQIVDLLREADRLENTWIFVVGDHGEEFFEHGSWGHRSTLYEEQLRVPFLVVPPETAEFTAPRTVAGQVTLSDLLPTVLDALELPASEHAVGRSLLPALRGEPLPERPALSSLRSRPRTRVDGGQVVTDHVLVDSFREQSSKLIRRLLVADGAATVSEVLYFDLERDPGESTPESDPSDSRLRAAYERLEAELARLNTHYDAVPHSPAESRASAGKEWLEASLQMLGYADGEPGPEGPDLEARSLPWGLRPTPPVPLDR